MKRYVVGIVVVALLAGAGWLLYVRPWSKPGAPAEAVEGPEDVFLVEAIRVSRGDLVEALELVGSLEAPTRVSVCAEVSGRLKQLFAEEGSAVTEGQVLAVIEDDTYRAQLHQADAAVAVAQATLTRAQVNRDNLTKEKQRIENLFRDGVATEQQRDDVLTRYHDARAAEDMAQAQLAQAQATLELAKIHLEDTTLRAPLAGVISGKRAERGDMVAPQVGIFDLVQMDVLEAHFSVSERYVSQLSEGGTRVEIQVDAYPEERFTGILSRIYPTVDEVTRTVELEVRVPNAEGRLKPGMFARGRLVLRERKDVVVVPDSALLQSGSQVLAFVVKGGTAVQRSLELGLLEGARAEVVEGLSAGELVVVKGQHLLRDGSKVTVREERKQ